jgi:hypothetical protein
MRNCLRNLGTVKFNQIDCVPRDRANLINKRLKYQKSTLYEHIHRCELNVITKFIMFIELYPLNQITILNFFMCSCTRLENI